MEAKNAISEVFRFDYYYVVGLAQSRGFVPVIDPAESM